MTVSECSCINVERTSSSIHEVSNRLLRIRLAFVRSWRTGYRNKTCINRNFRSTIWKSIFLRRFLQGTHWLLTAKFFSWIQQQTKFCHLVSLLIVDWSLLILNYDYLIFVAVRSRNVGRSQEDAIPWGFSVLFRIRLFVLQRQKSSWGFTS